MNRVSDDDRSTLFSFSARGASQGYAPQSGEIVGILKQLMAAQKEEEDRKANQAGLIAAKEEEIATLTATIETKPTQQGNLAAEVGRASRMTWPTRRGPWPLTRSWPPSSPKVVVASRRSGRSARRAGAREARFVHVVDLARQSRAIVFAWWNPCTSVLVARQMEELEESFAAGQALSLLMF